MKTEWKITKHRQVRTDRVKFNLLPDSCDGKGKLFHFSRCTGRHTRVAYFSWVGLWFWAGWGTA